MSSGTRERADELLSHGNISPEGGAISALSESNLPKLKMKK